MWITQGFDEAYLCFGLSLSSCGWVLKIENKRSLMETVNIFHTKGLQLGEIETPAAQIKVHMYETLCICFLAASPQEAKSYTMTVKKTLHLSSNKKSSS